MIVHDYRQYRVNKYLKQYNHQSLFRKQIFSYCSVQLNAYSLYTLQFRIRKITKLKTEPLPHTSDMLKWIL